MLIVVLIPIKPFPRGYVRIIILHTINSYTNVYFIMLHTFVTLFKITILFKLSVTYKKNYFKSIGKKKKR